ncbi:MAG TPA: hypothetical protein VFN83_04765 [Gemmatimonadales bacterium]|nr:hypothetical protein [Gemmatimonadales bacterium]
MIALDRDRKPLVCPSCDATDIIRTPARGSAEDTAGRVTLSCRNCGRSAVYLQRGSGPTVAPEAPHRS